MIYDGLVCSSCGAKNVVNTNGLFTCAYCHATVAPRFTPGSRCADLENGAFCGKPAESICSACARPLCDRHNNQKTIYWLEQVNWRNCCPEWDDDAGRAWGIITNPSVVLPIPGFEPFPWATPEAEVLSRVGEIELAMAAALKAIVNPIGGDFYETGIRFPGICSGCEADTYEKINQAIDSFRKSYRRVAYRDRLYALGAELKQGIKYVEMFLEGPSPDVGSPAPPPRSLGIASTRDEWAHFGADLKQRFAAARKLAGLLAKSTPRH